jgi:hypothetical protein
MTRPKLRIQSNLILNQGPLAKNQPLIASQGQVQRSVTTAQNKVENIGGHQTKIDYKPNQYLIHPRGHQCNMLKQVTLNPFLNY